MKSLYKKPTLFVIEVFENDVITTSIVSEKEFADKNWSDDKTDSWNF